MWKVCGRCWGRGRSPIKVSPLTDPFIANKWQEMTGYESGSNSVRIVFCCFIPLHSSVIQTRLSMIGYISLNATGKVNSRCNKLYRYYSTSFDLSCEKELFWSWILEDCPQVNKTQRNSSCPRLFSSLEITEENCTKKTWCDNQAYTLTFAGYVVKETKSKVLTGPDIKVTLLSGLWIVNRFVNMKQSVNLVFAFLWNVNYSIFFLHVKKF